MGKALVIVESPAKAKTINKYLGSDYIVKSSVGHIRSLHTGNREGKTPEEKLIDVLGFNPYDGKWKAKYVVDKNKTDVAKELKLLASKVDKIYLASDLDREGEAIAWHLQDMLGGDESKYVRVTFNEITKNAILKAFSQPGQVNQHMVEAQKTRQFTDKLTGFMVSPVLWKKIQRGLSAGRVQSVAVKLIVEREREIRAFIPDEYWEIKVNAHIGTSQLNGNAFTMQLLQAEGVTGDKLSKALIDKAFREDKVLAHLESPTTLYNVSKITSSESKSKPAPPFTTSTLQQAASNRLGFGVKRTMSAAQHLYEAGFITYMRTDSTNISQDALTAVRAYIQDNYGQRYLPEQPRFYASKENAQEAHEAIRPTNMFKAPLQDKHIGNDEIKLYNLIHSRFLACQMTDAIYQNTTVDFHTSTVEKPDTAYYQLRAKGKVTKFDGWTKAFPAKKEENEQELPLMEEKQLVHFLKVIPEQKYTRPPSRYSEAALVKELEKRGIGRPSTYASIITTIQERRYVKIEEKRFHAEHIGEVVTDRLQHSFPELMNYDNTAKLENTLDEIAEGKVEYKSVLDHFFHDLDTRCKLALKPFEEGGMQDTLLRVVDIVKCPTCQRPMVLRTGQNGYFLGCTGYKAEENPCSRTVALIPEKAIGDDVVNKHRCRNCNQLTLNYFIDSKTKLHVCENDVCLLVDREEGDFQLEKDESSYPCNVCGQEMKLQLGRFGKYLKCPNCANVRNFAKDGTVLPPKVPAIEFPELKRDKKGQYWVLRMFSSGAVVLVPNKYPKVKEFRNITISELIKFKDRLTDKFQYFLTAPEKDPAGDPTFVRFAKFENENIVTSYNKEGKPSGYRYKYRDGKWKLFQAKPKS